MAGPRIAPGEEEMGRARPSLADDIADAPGSLALGKVEERVRAQEYQFRHDNTIDPLAPSAGQAVTITATSGAGVRLARAALWYTADGSLPDVSSARLSMEVAAVDWDERVGYLTRWRAVLPPQPSGTVVRYRIGGWKSTDPSTDATEPEVWAQDGQGFWFTFPAEKGITTFAYLVEAGGRVRPEWMDEAVIYHVFLDRFHPGTPDGSFHGGDEPRSRHGGSLAGVHQALPYIADLGANCIWLSPIHPAETFHRYDTMDFFGIDPDLGSPEEMRSLVADAHALGIRVLMDFVPSHCSWHHPAFLAAQQDPSASTASWFTFDDWPHAYRSFLQMTPYLPSFNTDDPGARAHLIESAVYWMREYGVDGYRLDHAVAPGMDFWVALRVATEAVSSEVVLIAEATDTPDSLRRYSGKLHSILDFELAAALRLTFGTGTWDIASLAGLVDAYERFMADGPARVSFLDNHDMDRFLWLAENDAERLKLAALCQFTLCPTPVVYYGTEIGMTQRHGARGTFGGDAEARRDMPWDRSRWDHDLLVYYRRLTRLRREHPVLARGSRRTVHLDEEKNTWAYLTSASGEPAAGDILTVFNGGEALAAVELPAAIGRPHWTCLLATGGAPAVTAGAERVTVSLPGRSGAVLRSMAADDSPVYPSAG